MPPAVDSTLDVVSWFIDRAMGDREYLQPQKLHRLLYLAQAYYAVAHYGRKLMPATFVADEFGPIEPTIFRLYENGRPMVQPRPMTEAVTHFLDSVWRRFGAHSAEHLARQIKTHAPYAQAWRKAPRTEITLEVMIEFYTAARQPAAGAPPVTEVMRPRVMRAQDGQPVNVTKWMPPAVSKPTGRK